MNLKNILKDKNLKITNSRLLVLEIIKKLDIEATNKLIIEKTKLDKSTVYRILDLFLQKNIIEKKLNYNDEIYYSITNGHTHYINCIKCHKKEILDICPVSEIKTKGYTILNHKIEIDGICSNCQTRNT